MANSQLLALACLAVLAASAVAAPAAGCTTSSQNQAGTLTEQKPKGCLASKKVQDALQGLIPPACFNSVKMNVTNSTGADCPTATAGTFFNVSFADATNCLDGMDVGGGQMTAAPGGGSTVKGEFITGQSLTGSSTPAGLFTVTVAGMDCSLIYTTKNVGKPNVTTTGTTATKAADAAPAAAATTATAANTTAPATTARSSAAAAAPAALFALVAGALALAF